MRNATLITLLLANLLICCKRADSPLKAYDEALGQIIPGLRTQVKTEREFADNPLELIADIVFEKLEQPLFRPTFIQIDRFGSIYVLDFYDSAVHKFVEGSQGSYAHSILGKSVEARTSRQTRITDFKVFNDKVYLVDQITYAIDTYSIDGSFKGTITPDVRPWPGKIAFTGEWMVVQSGHEPGRVFYICSSTGDIGHAFGDRIDNANLDNPIYHDNDLSDTFDKDKYYYIPFYLGFVGLYQGDHLLFAKETIDGRKRRSEPIKKKILDNQFAISIKRAYETATLNAIHEDFVLIKASDLKNKKSYWDVYSLYEFDYILSLRNNPRSQAIAARGNRLACLSDSSLKIYDIRNILTEIRNKSTRISN